MLYFVAKETFKEISTRTFEVSIEDKGLLWFLIVVETTNVAISFMSYPHDWKELIAKIHLGSTIFFDLLT